MKTLVLLPGFMLDDALWDDFVACLPGDWSVRRIALPAGDTVGEVAGQVALQLDRPAVVIGFSMGGYVARALAAAHPALVEALVLVATSAREERPAAPVAGNGSRVVFRGLGRKAIQRSLGHAHAQDQALIDRIHAMSVRLGPDAFAWQSMLDRRGVPLQDISCPTLVVAAEEDQLRTIDESRALADGIPGAHLQILEATGHLIPLEVPDALAGLIVEWLRDN